MDGYRLKDFRKSLQMTQKELSEKTGLSLDQVKKLETGRNKLTSDKFRDIKKQLGLITDKSENPLRMMIDYLRMTFKNIRDIEYFVENILFISYTNFVEVASGLYGYNSSLRFGNIWLLYYFDAETRGNYNLTLQLSGQGCREMELYFENTGLTWQSWLERSMVFHEDTNITRIDIALDDLYQGYGNGSKHFKIPSIIEKMNSGLIKTKQFRSWEHVGGGIINNENFDAPDDKGVSVYFGSRQSSLYFNFYEKRFELAKKEKITVEESLEIFGIWNRYEVRYSHDTAQALVMKFIEGHDLGDMVRGLINQRLSVYQGIDEKWGSYIPDEKWQQLFGNVDYLKLTTQAEPYDIMRTVRWLYYQVSNSLALVKEYDRIVNRNFLEDILELGEITEVMEKRLENVRTQWFFNATAVGRSIIKRIKRVGRSENNFLVLITQSVDDTADEDDGTGFGTIFAFNSDTEAEKVLNRLKIPDTDETISWFESMTMGQCIFRDTFGRCERITVDGLFPEINVLFDTVETDMKAVA